MVDWSLIWVHSPVCGTVILKFESIQSRQFFKTKTLKLGFSYISISDKLFHKFWNWESNPSSHRHFQWPFEINNKILRNPSRLFVILEASDLIQTYSDRCICRVWNSWLYSRPNTLFIYFDAVKLFFKCHNRLQDFFILMFWYLKLYLLLWWMLYSVCGAFSFSRY